jgi:hypothetical protein
LAAQRALLSGFLLFALMVSFVDLFAGFRVNLCMFKKRFPVVVSGDFYSRHQSKRVLFRYEIDGKLVAMAGTFEIHKDSRAYHVCVVCPSFRFPSDPPNCYGRLVYLSQAHTDSIIPDNVVGSEVDFVIQLPFLFHPHIEDIKNRPGES